MRCHAFIIRSRPYLYGAGPSQQKAAAGRAGEVDNRSGVRAEASTEGVFGAFGLLNAH
jgi:hypothetical protein